MHLSPMIFAIPCIASFDVQWQGETSLTFNSRRNSPILMPSPTLCMWKPHMTAYILSTSETFCAFFTLSCFCYEGQFFSAFLPLTHYAFSIPSFLIPISLGTYPNQAHTWYWTVHKPLTVVRRRPFWFVGWGKVLSNQPKHVIFFR